MPHPRDIVLSVHTADAVTEKFIAIIAVVSPNVGSALITFNEIVDPIDTPLYAVP